MGVLSIRVEASREIILVHGTVEGDVTLNVTMEGGVSSAQELAKHISWRGRNISESTKTSA